MWMNDPNGMVFQKGEYHLFYQHFPDSAVWGPMHWGHAVSEDLIHWEHLPIALYPDSLGYIFSGSAVSDEDNTSGLGTADNPPIVAIYTYHSEELRRQGRKDFQTQGIAFSTDDGRNWKKYSGNPVLRNPGTEDFRDPKVFWHADTKMWIMILAVGDHLEFYRSKNLKSWEKSGEFGKTEGAHGGVWECPDLFPLRIDNENTEKWVMLVSINPGGIYGGSATQYFVGSFDGKQFTNDNPPSKLLWVDYGKDNYAGVTWANIPREDGRRIFLGWMSNWQYANVVPTKTWRSAMTTPRTLHLQNTQEGIRLVSRPVKELERIRKQSFALTPGKIDGTRELTGIPFEISTSEVVLEFEISGEDTHVGLEFRNDKQQKLIIGFDSPKKQFYIDRTNAGASDFSRDFAGTHYAPRISTNKIVRLHLILDVASAELFADNGEVVITDIFFPDELYNSVTIFCSRGAIQLKSGKITQLAKTR
jgi:fructan beta-fructosidase